MLAGEDLGRLHSAASLLERLGLTAALHSTWRQSPGALYPSLQAVVAWGLAGAHPRGPGWSALGKYHWCRVGPLRLAAGG